MIFRRGRRKDAEESSEQTEERLDETDPVEPEDADHEVGDEATDPEAGVAEQPAAEGRDWDAFDVSRDWREEGPFDITEVDLEADEVRRVDLGALIITPGPGMELRLQVAKENNAVVSAMLVAGGSALELAVFAAPRSGGLWSEIRTDVAAATTARKGRVTLAEGPFGTELRRLIPARTPDGKEGFQPSRTWAAEGPRWLLRGVVYGQAALVDGVGGAAEPLHELFASVVVRRGDTPKAAGDVITLTVPDDITIRPAAPARGAAAGTTPPGTTPPGTTPPGTGSTQGGQQGRAITG